MTLLSSIGFLLCRQAEVHYQAKQNKTQHTDTVAAAAVGDL